MDQLEEDRCSNLINEEEILVDNKPYNRRPRIESVSVVNNSEKKKYKLRSNSIFKRIHSCPVLFAHSNYFSCCNIFPDVSPRSLRIQEVKSWKRPWLNKTHETRVKKVQKDDFVGIMNANSAFEETVRSIMEGKPMPLSSSTGSTPTSWVENPPVNRPILKLKLEDMPTIQEAEDRAQRAADRLISRREREEEHGVVGCIKLNLGTDSSNDEFPTLNEERNSTGSQWSPNHGHFTTNAVSVSEAGISSPDSTYLHLLNDLVRVEEVGRGACGVVIKAIHAPTLKVVAVKDIAVYGKGQKKQMVRELHALQSNLVPLHTSNGNGKEKTRKGKTKANPYIVSFYDAFVDKTRNCVCLVMEYMGLGSLQDLVVCGGCTSEVILSRIAYCVLEGLAHIHHNRMVHRDIKPHNLLMNYFGEVKISDFGLARTLAENVNKTKTFVGTLLYMAPERIGGGDYSYEADIWSFGLSFVSVAIGKYPLPTQDGFFGLVDSVVNEECLKLPSDKFSKDCQDFVDQCLQIDPEKRASAADLLKHPFITKYKEQFSIQQWREFAIARCLCRPPEEEVISLADAIYKNSYNNINKFLHHTQSEYGSKFAMRFLPINKRSRTIERVEKSLQMGLSQYLGLSQEVVYAAFEERLTYYNCKLLEKNTSFSPQSWTASPGYNRRQQFLGSDSDSPIGSNNVSSHQKKKDSLWKRFHERIKRFGHRKEEKKIKVSGNKL